MDIRVKKTKRSIANAFLELRAKLPLEKIHVNELCKKAEINKSTFYTYYHDVYELSEELEAPALQSFRDIPHPEYVLTDSVAFVQELSQAYYASERILDILFSGNRSHLLIPQIAGELQKLISLQFPDSAGDPEFQVVLTYRIYGGCYAFRECRNYGVDKVVEIIGELNRPR